MSRSKALLVLVFFGAALITIPAIAKKKPGPKPADAQKALAFLLAISEEPIPPTSSCYGSFGSNGPPRVKDLLAMELASLSRGENKLTGKCTGQEELRCSISITHSFGEDVSSADITFGVRNGRAQAAALECVLTP